MVTVEPETLISDRDSNLNSNIKSWNKVFPKTSDENVKNKERK